MLNAKLSLLLGLASSTAVTVVDAATVTGWLYDNLCINNCKDTSGPTSCTPDGSNAFYTPSVHTGECLLFDFCIESGHSIMSEFPGEDGRHSVVLKLIDGANTTAYELVKNSGITTAFPKVEVVFEDSQVVSTDADGVPSVSTVTSLTTVAPPMDPWAENPEKYYSGAPTTQAVCNKSSDGSIEKNNMCFRSDVQVSEEDDMIVIESNGCPDHMNMVGGSNGTVEDVNEFPCDVYEFAPGCNKDKPAGGCCGGGCCGKCGGCNACSDKCNACGTVSGCSTKECSSCAAKTCTACSATCGATGGCSSKACGACSATSCGACSAGGCSPKACSACSATSCGSSGGCSAGDSCSAKACSTCSGGCSSGCSSKTCSTECSSKTCSACGTTATACGASGCSKCDACSSCGCAGKCCSSDSVGKYTPFFQHYTMKIPKDPAAPGDKQLFNGDVVGLMFNGVILDSHKQTWAYDVCDGHSDEKHQYHYHIPQSCYLKSMGVAFADSSNWWISDAGDEVRKFDEMAAQFPATGPASPVIGMALDGFPIYGLYDDQGALQRSKAFGGSLDECNGKMDSQNNYGYYLSADPPFAPACLKGSKIGTFEYSTYNKACPKEGIKNTIQLPSDVQVKGDDQSAAPVNIPYVMASLAAVVSALLL